MKQINETTAAFILGVLKYLGDIAVAIIPILKNKKKRKENVPLPETDKKPEVQGE